MIDAHHKQFYAIIADDGLIFSNNLLFSISGCREGLTVETFKARGRYHKTLCYLVIVEYVNYIEIPLEILIQKQDELVYHRIKLDRQKCEESTEVLYNLYYTQCDLVAYVIITILCITTLLPLFTLQTS